MSDSANLIHSPLHQRHIELGAKLAPFGGWEMPLEYAGGGVLAEHGATRDAVGIFDVSHLGTATLTGPNAADRLNEVLTNDINRIQPGQAQYSTILSENGTVVDDLIVYLRSKDEVLLIPNAGNSTTVLEIIKQNIPADIVVKNLHKDIAIIAIQGPKSVELVKDLGLPTDMEYMSFKDVSFMGNSVTICRTGYTGEKGFEVLVPAANALSFWDEVFKKGQKFGAKAVGLGARDTLRTEMGYPLHGQDISLKISPLEAGLNWAVILDKPKFLGKDALVKEKANGLKRKLVGIKAVERAIPRSHMKVMDQSNHELGEITSGTFSPTLREGIALALLESNVKVGDKVFVEKGGEIIPKIIAVAERGNESFPTVYITNCPECQTALERKEGEANHYCPNFYGCPPQIVGRIQHYITRKAMDIEGLGGETVALLYQNGLVKNYADLYDLKIEQILPLERMAQKSAENLINGIEKSKEVPFERVLYALGIRYVGETVAKKLAKHYKNIDAIANASLMDLILVDEIGDKIAQSVIEFFENIENRITIERLKSVGIQFELVEKNTQVSDKFAGKTFVVSGVFEKFSRDDLKKAIEDNGGKVGSSISTKTDYVVAGENMGPAKLEKANQLKIAIISEEDFLRILNN